jgi:uncharacterized protein YdaU (DUF1376 family)
MHYYQFNIGDYKAATAHLSNEEDLAYRRLLDMYYDSETKIPLDTQWVARRIRVSCEVVQIVLQDMFEQQEDGWFHARCEDVIVAYHAMAEKNRANGRLGGRKKNPVGIPVASDTQPIVKATINHKLETINHKPIKNTVAPPNGVTDSVWQDWLSLRKTKKAAVTQTAIDGIAREASKAGVSLQTALETCCARGWTGFKADWLKDKSEQKSFAEKDYDFKRKQWEAMTGRTSESNNFLGLEDDSTH